MLFLLCFDFFPPVRLYQAEKGCLPRLAYAEEKIKAIRFFGLLKAIWHIDLSPVKAVY